MKSRERAQEPQLSSLTALIYIKCGREPSRSPPRPRCNPRPQQIPPKGIMRLEFARVLRSTPAFAYVGLKTRLIRSHYSFGWNLLWARIPSSARRWFGPAPIARFFRRDSGIRLRPTKKSAIAAGPHHLRPTDGIRTPKMKRFGLSPATFVALEAQTAPPLPGASLVEVYAVAYG